MDLPAPRPRFPFLNECDLHQRNDPRGHASGGINDVHGPDTIRAGVLIHACWMRRCSSATVPTVGTLRKSSLAVSEAGRDHGRRNAALVAITIMPSCFDVRELVAPNPAPPAKSSTGHYFRAEKRASHLITPRGGPTAEHLLHIECGTRARIMTKASEPFSSRAAHPWPSYCTCTRHGVLGSRTSAGSRAPSSSILRTGSRTDRGPTRAMIRPDTISSSEYREYHRAFSGFKPASPNKRTC